MAKTVLAVVIAYLLGCISPATILAKARGLDIKKEGSGNAGTTNILRVLGAKPALITLVVDIGKGVLAVLIGQALGGHDAAMFCCLAAFLGHVFPVFLKFKGGKGVAVAFGVLLALNWKLAVLMLLIVALVVFSTRMVSVGSLGAALSFPFCCYLLERDFIYIGLIMAILIVFNHRENIKRLAKGEEDRIDLNKFKKKGGNQ